MSRPFNPPSNYFPGLIEPGNIINLYNRPVTKAPAGPSGLQTGDQLGQTSTTFSKSFNINGKETLIPTVVDGKFLTDDEAVDRFKKTGQHLGIFADPKSADEYVGLLHKSQEAVGNYYGATSQLKPQPAKKRTARK